MKKVVSVVGAPFRVIARLLRAILRAPRGAVRRIRMPRGKSRIVAFAVLAVVIVGAVVVLRPRKNEEQQVRDTLADYAKASRAKDYQTLCDDLLATELVDRIRAAGLPCEVALRTGLEDRSNPTLTVGGVEVNGDQALASVHGEATGEVPADTTYRLVREDGHWRIATPPGSNGATPTP